jgi:hypothetical protein
MINLTTMNLKEQVIGLLMLCAVTVALPACKRAEGCTDPTATNYDPHADKDCCCEYAAPTPSNTIEVTEAISVNTTWTNTHTYLLKGFIYVNDGATLTIEPGTIIKGDKPTKGTLIVRRGGKLMAEGTIDRPIIFTSNQPPGSRDYGDWGGIIICGRAPHNQPSDPTIEGGPDAQYGGNDPDDNSGTLRYVRIEFPGVAFQPNQEINGLTMASVGRGTTIDHVQVSYCGDDSYEWFGGTVNARYLIAFRGWDDDFDQDFGWQGKVQFALGLRDPNIADQSSSNGFECDNDAAGNSAAPYSQGTWSNVTLIGPKADVGTSINPLYARALHLRRNTRTRVYNSVFAGYPVGLYIDGNSTQTNADNGDLQFRNNVLAGMDNPLATPAGQQWDQATITAWFHTVGWNNTILGSNDELGLIAPFDLGHPDPRPNSGAALLSGAEFSGPLTDGFFDPVPFRGAFGATDWTAGWTNWDPQHTSY